MKTMMKKVLSLFLKRPEPNLINLLSNNLTRQNCTGRQVIFLGEAQKNSWPVKEVCNGGPVEIRKDGARSALHSL